MLRFQQASRFNTDKCFHWSNKSFWCFRRVWYEVSHALFQLFVSFLGHIKRNQQLQNLNRNHHLFWPTHTHIATTVCTRMLENHGQWTSWAIILKHNMYLCMKHIINNYSICIVSIYVGVSKNIGTPKSSNLIGFSIINHPFWDTPIFGNTHMYIHPCHNLWCFTFRRGEKGPKHPDFFSGAQASNSSRLAPLCNMPGIRWRIVDISRYKRYVNIGVEPKIGGFYPPNGWWKKWKTLLKWMIWGYPYSWKHPYIVW